MVTLLRRAGWICLFFLLWMGAGLVQTGVAHAQKIATLEKVQGNVRVFEAGSRRGKKGRNGMALFVNSTVKTLGADARADLVYLKGGVVRIMGNSEVTLDDTEFTEKKTNARLKLAAGKIFNVVTKLTEGSSYEVVTLTGTAGVKGTIFSAETNPSQSVFMVKEGRVEVTGAQRQVLVPDLKKTVVAANQAPTEPVDLTPEEIAMFDILDDLLETIKSDIKEDIQESIKEDIIQDAIEQGLGNMP